MKAKSHCFKKNHIHIKNPLLFTVHLPSAQPRGFSDRVFSPCPGVAPGDYPSGLCTVSFSACCRRAGTDFRSS